MVSEWQQLSISEVAASTRNALVGGPFGSNLVASDYVPSGVPVIRGQNMGSRWVGGEFAFVSASKAKSLEANLARPGDLVFTQRGTLGQVALVPPAPFDRYVVSQSQMKLTVDGKKADPLFLYYVFSSQRQQDYIRQHAIQTGVPHTNLGILRTTPIPVPPLEEQRAIAIILGTLDDKIELNRQKNETLEAIARALFKSWFVDFDPVRAKAEGRDAGLPKNIADVFPDSFQDSESELGDIPRGWLGRSVYDCAKFVNGLAFRTGSFSQEKLGLPVLKIAELKSGITSQTKFTTDEFEPRYRVRSGDVLFSWSGSPDTSIDIFLWTDVDGWLNQHIFKVQFHESNQKLFVYYLLVSLRKTFIEIARNKQTTGLGHVTAEDMKRLQICWPSQDVLCAFERTTGPLFNKAYSNRKVSRLLTDLRDTLLPKLISGELRIAAAERIVGGLD